MIKGLINVGRNGYLWFLERTSDDITFVEGKPFVKQDVFKSLDPKTGRPEIDPDHKPGTGKKVSHGPSVFGGKNWPPVAFSPETRMIDIPANENTCGTSEGREVEYKPGSSFIGAIGFHLAPGADHIGEVQRHGMSIPDKRVWTHDFTKSPNWGPILATGGGLVFSGGTNDRMFRAYDASNGTVLWEFPTNSGVIGTPASFSIDGAQYIAVQSGWGLDAAHMQRFLNAESPGDFPPVP